MSFRSPFLLPGLGVLACLVAFAVLLAVLSPAPPHTIRMATGAPGSAYAAFGEQYRDVLARYGVKADLVETGGAVDNVRMLSDANSKVSVAFVQAGVTNAENAPELESLGTLFYEPVWIFTYGKVPANAAELLHGKRVSIGPEGSGTRKLALELINALGLDVSGNTHLGLTARESGTALLRGEIDVAVIVAPWESEAVRRLLAAPNINALPFPRADAHVALRPYLNKLVVPQGVADMAANRPPHDLVLVAPKGSLVVRKDLHPALQYLLLEAASQIHSRPGIFTRAGQFPAAEPIDLPLSDQARQFYHSGAPFLQRYLPFWMAVFVARLLVLLIPILGVAYPLFRLLQALYGWGMRRRIFTLYGELKFLEAALEARPPESPVDDLRARLAKLEDRANHMRVPIGFAHMLYTLRTHIGLVRARLDRQ
jgi:TRAP transporter TAXI family solute receptor